MPLSAEQLAALIERLAVPLELWAGRRCRSAEDVVQEAFCRLAVLDPPPDRPAAWLYRVVCNLAETERTSNERRTSRERKVSVRESLHEDPAERMFVDEVMKAVLQLDDDLREILTARIWGQLSLEEIGEMCEISTATASRRYRDALVQLRKLLGLPCQTTNF